MLNVLYISHEGDTVLGSSRSLLNMINSLRGKVNAFVIVPTKSEAYNYFKANNINVYAIAFPLDITDKHGLKRCISIIPRLFRDVVTYNKAIKQISNIVDKNSIDIVHSNSSTVDIGFYVAKKMNKPHIWHLREFQDLDFHFRPAYGWHRLLKIIKKSSATICITKAIQKHFGLENSKNSYQIFNAVRSQKDACFITDKDKYFLVCGNLSKAKGCEIAMRAFAVFNSKHSGYRLKFVGSITSMYKNELMQLAKSLNIDKFIDFEGYQAETKRFYCKASAFLMCSRNEAMGRVTVEAMFYGCPVIGYNGGGTKEIINNGTDGFLFSSQEECSALMEKVITDTNINQMILNAQQKAINLFSEENYGKKIYSIYQKVLHR